MALASIKSLSAATVDWRDKLAYSTGSLGKEIVHGIVSGCVFLYCIQVLHMEVKTLCLLYIVQNLLGLVLSPLFGIWLDNTHSRFGKYKPLAGCGVFINLCALIAFYFTPQVQSAPQVYIACIYLLWSLSFFMLDIPSWSLLSMFNTNLSMRDTMATVPCIANHLGCQLAVLCTLPLLEQLPFVFTVDVYKYTAATLCAFGIMLISQSVFLFLLRTNIDVLYTPDSQNRRVTPPVSATKVAPAAEVANSAVSAYISTRSAISTTQYQTRNYNIAASATGKNHNGKDALPSIMGDNADWTQSAILESRLEQNADAPTESWLRHSTNASATFAHGLQQTYTTAPDSDNASDSARDSDSDRNSDSASATTANISNTTTEYQAAPHPAEQENNSVAVAATLIPDNQLSPSHESARQHWWQLQKLWLVLLNFFNTLRGNKNSAPRLHIGGASGFNGKLQHTQLEAAQAQQRALQQAQQRAPQQTQRQHQRQVQNQEQEQEQKATTVTHAQRDIGTSIGTSLKMLGNASKAYSMGTMHRVDRAAQAATSPYSHHAFHSHYQTQHPLTLKTIGLVLVKNDQLMVIFLCTVLLNIVFGLILGGFISVAVQKKLIFDISFYAVLIVGSFVQLSAMVTFEPLVRRTSRPFVFKSSLLLVLMGFSLMLTINTFASMLFPLFTACIILCNYGVGLCKVALTSMTVDIVDYGEFKLSLRTDGLIFSLRAMAHHLASLISLFFYGGAFSMAYFFGAQKESGLTLNLHFAVGVVFSLVLLTMLIYHSKYKLNGAFYRNVLNNLQYLKQNQNRNPTPQSHFMLRYSLDESTMIIKLKAKSVNDVVKAMVQKLSEVNAITSEHDYMLDLQNRLAKGPCGIAEGIALPHAKSSAVRRATVVVATLDTPLDMGALDGRKCDLVFLLASPDDGYTHLNLLGRLSLLLNEQNFADKLRTSGSPTEMFERLVQCEKHLVR